MFERDDFVEQNDTLNYLYSKRNELLEKKGKYMDAISIAVNIGDKLFQCGNKLNTIRDNMHANFTIEGMTADGGRIEMMISTIGEIHNFFSSNLVSQIDTELTSLSKQIANYDSQINAEIAKQKAEANK